MMGPAERLQALILSGTFSWEHDGDTLRAALLEIRRLQAAALELAKMVTA